MDQLIVGFIRGSHGLSGKCKVESTSGESEHFFSLTEVTIRSGDVSKVLAVESVEGSDTNLILKLESINSSEDVKKYSGWEILVPRKMACPLTKDEYYVEDLKGCSLIADKDGLAAMTGVATENVVGTITGVLEGGAGDLLEVELSESVYTALNTTAKGSKIRLIPFQKEFIGTVDIKGKTVQLMHLWILE